MNAKRNVMIIFSFISSFLAIGLFGLFLYISPYVLFNLRYEVPSFVTQMAVMFKDNHGIDGFLLITLMLLPLLLGAIIFAYIGRILSDSVEKVAVDDTLKASAVKQIDHMEKDDVAEQVDSTVIEDEDAREVTFSVKASATEILNEAGEVIAIETTQPRLVAEESKPELFETDVHLEPIIYSKSQTVTLVLKLGALIVAVLVLILLADFLLRMG